MKMTCITCPMGCQLEVTEENGSYTVTGNTCPRGAKYAIAEMTAPTRMLTTIVPTDRGNMVSVKSREALPKGSIFDAMKIINKAKVKEPVKIGDVVIENILGTGIDIIATKNLE